MKMHTKHGHHQIHSDRQRVFFREYPNPFRPDDDILKLLEICLTTNKLEFAERLFLQVLGMAMGKSFAPSLATKLDR